MPKAYPDAYLDGLRAFNAGEFFHCHDVLEDLWRETTGQEKLFYKGLIHAAVALYHFSEGNLGGARKMCLSACKYLEPYGPRYMGLEVERLTADLKHCFGELLEAREGYPTGLTLDEQRIPKIAIPGE